MQPNTNTYSIVFMYIYIYKFNDILYRMQQKVVLTVPKYIYSYSAESK